MADFLENELCHHGIKGQRWGVRRYQHEDGSLTPAGRRHWGVGPPEKGSAETTRSGRRSSSESEKTESKSTNSEKKNSEVSGSRKGSSSESEKKSETTARSEQSRTETSNFKKTASVKENPEGDSDNARAAKFESDEINRAKKALNKNTIKNALLIGGGIAVAGLASYGAYKYAEKNFDITKMLDESGTIRMPKLFKVNIDYGHSKDFIPSDSYEFGTAIRNLASIGSQVKAARPDATVMDQIAALANIPTYKGDASTKSIRNPYSMEVLDDIKEDAIDTRRGELPSVWYTRFDKDGFSEYAFNTTTQRSKMDTITDLEEQNAWYKAYGRPLQETVEYIELVPRTVLTSTVDNRTTSEKVKARMQTGFDSIKSFFEKDQS